MLWNILKDKINRRMSAPASDRRLPRRTFSENQGRDVSSTCLDKLLIKPLRFPVLYPTLGYGPGSALFLKISNVPGAGYGLFSRIYFAPGDVISLYDGIVMHNSQVVKANTPPAAAFSHVCKVKGTEYVILGLQYAIEGRGMGSFANHSHSNNSRLVPRNRKVRYFNHHHAIYLTRCMVVEAITSISPGEEISVRYSSHTLARLDIRQ